MQGPSRVSKLESNGNQAIRVADETPVNHDYIDLGTHLKGIAEQSPRSYGSDYAQGPS